MNIYQKLAKIRKIVEVVRKNKAGYGYKYVSDDELLAKITAGMEKYSLSLVPSVIPNTLIVEPYPYKKTKRDKVEGKVVTYEENVNEILVQAEMAYTWVNNDDPSEVVTVPWVMVGQQSDASQSFGSALTYSMRYFLLKYFNVSTPEDDPDNWRSKQRAAEVAEDSAIAKQIISNLDISIKSYLADNPGDSDKVRAFATKYVKGGNYFSITESAVATKMMDDFNKNFVNKKEQ